MFKQVVNKCRRVPLVAYATGFFVFGVAGTRPLVPLYSIDLGTSVEEVGVLVATFALIPLSLAMFLGKKMDQTGTRSILLVSVLVTFAGLTLPYVLEGRPGIYLSQLIAGTGFTTFILAGQKRMSDSVAVSTRERNIAILSLSVALGAMLGPLAAGVIGDATSNKAAFAILALFILPSACFLLPLAPDRPIGTGAPSRGFSNPLKVFGYNRFMARAFLISSLILLGRDMYVAYFPLYAHNVGISASIIGVIIGIHNGGGVISRYFALKLVRAYGKSRVVVTSILLSGLAFLMIPLTGNVLLLTLMSLAIGMGLGIGQPLSISTTVTLSPAAKVGEVLGFRLTCNRLTQVVTPLSFGVIATFTGVMGIFWVIGGILIVGCTRVSIPNEDLSP
ncbi:MFS transporter [Roseovarius sp.]|uniref:MFS transporter n=1 Tax=Roseovarius sp. TaxID=1486281 RepID=UPI0035681856